MIAGTNRNRVSKRAMRPKLAPSSATPVVALPLKVKPIYRVLIMSIDGDDVSLVTEHFRTDWEGEAKHFIERFNASSIGGVPQPSLNRKLWAVMLEVEPIVAEDVN